ncbi:MAG: hypothetical protein WCA44_04720 [Acidobacteriaceae bacterium]
MPQRSVRYIFSLAVLALVSATIALAESPARSDIPIGNTWQTAQSTGSSKHKLLVVTFDQPRRRQTCRIQSFTQDKLVCSRAFGGSRTYLRRQILAVILPGDGSLKLALALGFNGGLGAAIWGTVVLAAACPACAVATGIAAFFCFSAAGAVLIGDDQPDRLLYLAPGQHLTGKLRLVQP